MAKKKKEVKEEVKETIYTIPLRKAYGKMRSRRSDNAVKVVGEYLKKHTKDPEIRISEKVNERLWSAGRYAPPRSIKVKVVTEDGKTKAELVE